MKKELLAFLVCSITLIFCLGYLLSYSKIDNIVDKDTIMMSVTMNETKSDFDNWLTNNLIEYVPSYIVIDGYEVIGIIDGGIGIKEIKKEYNEIIENHNCLVNLRDTNTEVYFPYRSTIECLLDVLDTDQKTILEVHKISCSHCQQLDISNGETSQMHKEIDAIFYRYYIKSNLEDILKRYN